MPLRTLEVSIQSFDAEHPAKQRWVQTDYSIFMVKFGLI
jgi:hypothetical protein